MPRRLIALAASLAVPLALAACGGAKDTDANLASIDAELAPNSAASTKDPALTSALGGQIMVDPQLAQQANNDAVRPPAQPHSGQLPADDVAAAAQKAGTAGDALRSAPAPSGDCPGCKAKDTSFTLAALAQAQGTGSADCVQRVSYSAGWANRLPRGVPLYPDARLSEAAGAADNGCTLRVVSFSTGAPLQRVLDWYYTRTSDAGFSAHHEATGSEHMLGGTRANDGGAFAVWLRPRDGGGTDVDLVANNGT